MGKHSKMVKSILELEEKLTDNPLLVCIRRGLTLMIPLVLIYSIALLFISLPIPQYQSFMKHIFGSEWTNVFVYIRDGTYSILSLIMVLCISYSYVSEFGKRYKQNASPIIASVVSLCSYIALFGINKKSFSIENYGVSCTFIAIVVAITSSFLFLKFSSIKLVKKEIFIDGDNTVFNDALSAICPAVITISLFAICDLVLSRYFGITDVRSISSAFFCSVFYKINSPFWRGILFVVLTHIMWFFGIHGNNILDPVSQAFFVPAVTVNQNLISAG